MPTNDWPYYFGNALSQVPGVIGDYGGRALLSLDEKIQQDADRRRQELESNTSSFMAGLHQEPTYAQPSYIQQPRTQPPPGMQNLPLDPSKPQHFDTLPFDPSAPSGMTLLGSGPADLGDPYDPSYEGQRPDKASELDAREALYNADPEGFGRTLRSNAMREHPESSYLRVTARGDPRGAMQDYYPDQHTGSNVSSFNLDDVAYKPDSYYEDLGREAGAARNIAAVRDPYGLKLREAMMDQEIRKGTALEQAKAAGREAQFAPIDKFIDSDAQAKLGELRQHPRYQTSSAQSRQAAERDILAQAEEAKLRARLYGMTKKYPAPGTDPLQGEEAYGPSGGG